MARARPHRPDSCRALITGGSGGIGRAISRSLAVSGFSVIVHARTGLERARAVVDEISDSGGQAEAVAFDLSDAAATEKAMQGLTENEPLGVVVHNAGQHIDVPMAGMSAAQWDSVVEVNLNAFYRVVQPALMGMARQRWGRIVALSSVAARLGNRGQTNYAGAKAGLHGTVFSLCREMASRGVTANIVAPGMIETPMLEDLPSTEQLKQLVPAGRIGQPDEVAALVDFLCSDQAAYVNGQLIGVDGGMAPG